MSWDELAPDGVYPIAGANALFLEPCRMISSAYAHYFALPHRYYSRSFFLRHHDHSADNPQTQLPQKKRKRKRKKPIHNHSNPKELLAEQRHQGIRQFILDAHQAFLAIPEVSDLLKSLEDLVHKSKGSSDCEEIHDTGTDMVDFVKLSYVWQSPFYDITLFGVQGSSLRSTAPISTFPLFKSTVENNLHKESIGICAGTTVILPEKSRFLMSDFADTWRTLASHLGNDYNFILIDPPWENKSVHRHAPYSTLPNKYLLSLPLKDLANHQGALIGLWVTNREKLWTFVEKELFPAWGVNLQAIWYWLKVKSDGQMITELDISHHKPYECLLLGYMLPHHKKDSSQVPPPKVPPDKQVLISIPGDHSRKPPLASLLSAYVPGHDQMRGLELFARDLHPGCTSWGNEPLRFQQTQYFSKRQTEEDSFP
ncbi:hypothetical protein KP509_28G021900 [Ceratopteris richardii]|uniref:Uncharacterized protein n=1 Tax=Ceratopteris richardii TaxID=49495 RepID=A0A8T2RCV9_CERRI|nr:hypothetical protein KP509_28G021900 [Ceratopteris richardii]